MKKGVGSREWEMGSENYFTTPHSPFPSPAFIRNPQSEDLHFLLIVSWFLTLLTPEVLRAISSALDFSSAFSTSPVIVTSPFFTSTFVPKIPLVAY